MPEKNTEGWSGARMAFRDLSWDVLEAIPAGGQTALRLRCNTAGLTGVEWLALHPAEPVIRIDERFRPKAPAPLAAWRLRQTAMALDGRMSGNIGMAPGRLRAEPYQMVPLLRILDLPRPRLLLADDVGLGKTVEACLVMAGLMARRQAHRVAVITPAGPLLAQWDAELRLRFGLAFRRMDGLAALNAERRRHEFGRNPFEAAGRCLISLDFAKQEHVLEDLERARWDLAIIDEAHHCIIDGACHGEAGQHRRLAEVIAAQSNALLLLTATPHDGIEAHFASLLALLDPSLVDAAGRPKPAHRACVVRRLKGHLRGPDGAPQFADRRVTPVRVDAASARHTPVRAFHEALAALVVPRIEASRAPTRDGDVFAFVGLLKRSVSSITASIATLGVVARRYRAGGAETTRLKRERQRAIRELHAKQAQFGALDTEDEAALERLEQEGMAAQLRGGTLGAVLDLIRLGRTARHADPKLEALVTEIANIRAKRARANILVFTEYIGTQEAAVAALQAAMPDTQILAIGGTDPEHVRIRIATRFAEEDGIVLISTDALAEGLNLHRRCCDLIHLDLPYNPNRLEQRNGRIDRFGQTCAPDIRYLFLAGTFEEDLLLRLITRHERARASLGSMPETLGVTSACASDSAVRGFAQRQEELFAPPDDAIRTLDRAAIEARLTAYRTLLHDVESAYDGRAAMRFGWMPLAPTAQDVDAAGRAAATLHCASAVDLPDFVAEVVSADVGLPQTQADILRLNQTWCAGLDGVPGFDSGDRIFRFTRDPEVFVSEGRSVGFLGAMHPLVQRAISRAQTLGGPVDLRVAVARGGPALLLTYEIDICSGHGLEFSQSFAVLAPRRGRLRVLLDAIEWLALARHDAGPVTDVWDRCFADWANDRVQAARTVADSETQRQAEAFAHVYAERHSRRWVETIAVPPTQDLFDPIDDALGSGRPAPHPAPALHPPRLRPTGLLMLLA